MVDVQRRWQWWRRRRHCPSFATISTTTTTTSFLLILQLALLCVISIDAATIHRQRRGGTATTTAAAAATTSTSASVQRALYTDEIPENFARIKFAPPRTRDQTKSSGSITIAAHKWKVNQDLLPGTAYVDHFLQAIQKNPGDDTGTYPTQLGMLTPLQQKYGTRKDYWTQRIPNNANHLAYRGSVYPNMYLTPDQSTLALREPRHDVDHPWNFVETGASATVHDEPPMPLSDDYREDREILGERTPYQKVEEPTPWCRKVLYHWLATCVYTHPDGIGGRRMCQLLLNSWMQKCVRGSYAAERHSREVDRENAPDGAEL